MSESAAENKAMNYWEEIKIGKNPSVSFTFDQAKSDVSRGKGDGRQ